MIDFIKDNAALFSAISTLINISVLGFILKLLKETRAIQNDRIKSAKEKFEILEERLKLAEDEKKRIEAIGNKIGEIGETLGIPIIEDKMKVLSGVSIGGDLGENFSGNIAGRDLNKIDTLIDSSNKVLERISAVRSNDDNKYEYFVTHPYSRNIEMTKVVKRGFKHTDVYLNAIAGEIDKQCQNGWEFWELSRGHQYGLEDAVLIFRRPKQL